VESTWIRVGAFAGLIGTLAYFIAILAPVPLLAQVLLVTVWGLCMSLGAPGLYFLLALNRKTVSLQVGVASSAVAGIVVLTMLIVQISVNAAVVPMIDAPPEGASEAMVRTAWNVVDQVQLGLDIVWDIYLCLSAILIAWNMRQHPRFGLFFTVTGILIAGTLFAFNMATFPVPPANAGSIDLGPLMGLWFLVVTIQVFRSFGWADRALADHGK
jgi:hypothetical protein